MTANVSIYRQENPVLIEILDVGLRAGELLLRYGAEAWRVEYTVQRMLEGLGARQPGVLATATTISVSVSDGCRSQARVKRVRMEAFNLSVIDAVNTLSRRVEREHLPPETVREELEQIERQAPVYSFPVMVISALVGGSGFVSLFGGGLAEIIATLPGAAVVAITYLTLVRTQFPILASTAVTSLAGTVMAALGARLPVVDQPDVVIVSAVVLLVPGAAIVNAIGDLMGGHLLAGLARGAASTLVTAAIAAGVAAGLQLTGTIL